MNKILSYIIRYINLLKISNSLKSSSVIVFMLFIIFWSKPFEMFLSQKNIKRKSATIYDGHHSYTNKNYHFDETEISLSAIRVLKGNYDPDYYNYPHGSIYLLSLFIKIFKVDGIVSNSKFFKDSINDHYNWLHYRLNISKDSPTLKNVAFNIPFSKILSLILSSLIATFIYQICVKKFGVSYAILGTLITLLCNSLSTFSKYYIVDIPLATISTLFFASLSKTQNFNSKTIFTLLVLSAIATAIKYTAIFLLFIPILLSFNYSKKNNIFFSKSVFTKSITLLSVCLLIGTTFLMVRQKYVFSYLLQFTSDNFIEPTYFSYFNTFIYIFFGFSIVLIIAISIFRDKFFITFKNIFNPYTIKLLILFTLIIFIISPYTFINWQKGLKYFLYEMRHMNFGYAAQMKYNSVEYHDYLNKLNIFDPIIFYLNQIKLNFGLSGSFFLIIGLSKHRKNFDYYLLIFSLLYFFIISNWVFFNARYLLVLYPIIIYQILNGIYLIDVLLSQRIKYTHQIKYFFILIIIIEQLNNYFIIH